MSSDYCFYSDELSAHERALGFELRRTADPRRRPSEAARVIPAVVFMVSRTDRIIKSRLPMGHFAYGFQRFGIWEWQSADQADWKPLSEVTYPTPEMALALIRARVEVFARALPPRVIPVEPGADAEVY
ncbi:MAG: hypothetical protein IRY99_00300 [Isosphaeraceae bacterium]|nr:hypothetical protein [Isosphaeraceae bacterium]